MEKRSLTLAESPPPEVNEKIKGRLLSGTKINRGIMRLSNAMIHASAFVVQRTCRRPLRNLPTNLRLILRLIALSRRLQPAKLLHGAEVSTTRSFGSGGEKTWRNLRCERAIELRSSVYRSRDSDPFLPLNKHSRTRGFKRLAFRALCLPLGSFSIEIIGKIDREKI